MHAQYRARPSTRICLAVLWVALSALCIYPSGPRTKTSSNLLTVVVDGRALSGPGTSARREAGRVLVPVSAIARVLHFAIEVDGRTVTVGRPGVKAVLDAASGRILENGGVVLTFTGGAEIIFPAAASELMLPSE